MTDRPPDFVGAVRLVLPSLRTVGLVGLALLLGAGGAVLAFAFALDMIAEGKGGTALFGVAMFVGSPLILGLSAAALSEPRSIPSGAIWLLAGVVSLISGVVLSAGIMSDNGEVAAGIVSGLLCCGLPSLLPVVLGISGIVRGVGSRVDDLQALRLAALRKLVTGRRLVSYDELVAKTGIPEPELFDLLWRLVTDTNEVRGNVHAKARCFISTEAELAGMTQFVGLVATRGRITVAELARELDVPEQVIHSWVIAQNAMGKFRGAFHQNVVFSEEATRQKGGACPNCGGKLSPGRGVLVCGSCDTEVFTGE